ncbi:hypothetical protein AVEN_217879-1 [Araneus ventricosus]|uniref:C2H2-type domain-containing protein n=1 Tax=Araneus ventricosus TaxID=182803 RepID=A0A4Y2RP81_ARAVE|nr:hypothetical protein AVEN_217879-1 [Araneus ventricosus]
MIHLPIDTPFMCPDCQEPFPNELGLRNHVAAHRKQTALDSSVQRVIPRMGTKKWKKKKTSPSAANTSEAPDVSITDPNCVLAPPVQEPTALSSTPQQETSPPGPLSIYIDHLNDFLNQELTEELFSMFCETVEMAISEIQSISFQSTSPPPEQTQNETVARKPRKEINVNDAVMPDALR